MTNYSSKCCSGAAVATTRLCYKRVQTAIQRNNGCSNKCYDFSQTHSWGLHVGKLGLILHFFQSGFSPIALQPQKNTALCTKGSD